MMALSGVLSSCDMLTWVVCPDFRGVENLDCYAVIQQGGQRGQTRRTGPARVSCGASTEGDRAPGHGAEGGGRRAGPGGQRAGDLWLAAPGAGRPWARTRAEHRGEGGARGGQAADPRAGGGAGGASARRRAAQGEPRPKSRFAAIGVMASEGLSAQVACRVLGVSESGYYARRKRPVSARAVRH